MAGNKESKSFRKERRWIENSSGDVSNNYQDGLTKNLIEDIGKFDKIGCKKRWYTTILGNL